MAAEFCIKIEPKAVGEIQEAVIFYSSKKTGLGKRFFTTIDKHFEFLKKNYFAFSIRYDNVRCIPVKKFPYTIHYMVDESNKVVRVISVFCTLQNPDKLGAGNL